MTFEQYFQIWRASFLNTKDANDLILQMRTWEKHDVGATPGFGGDVEKALRSIKAPLLYMPSESDMAFPVGDARYEAPLHSRRDADAHPLTVGTHAMAASVNPA